MDETILNLKELKNNIDSERQNLLGVKKNLFSSPQKSDRPSKMDGLNSTVPSTNLKSPSSKILSPEQRRDYEIDLLKKKIQNLEKIIQGQASRTNSNSPFRILSNKYSSRSASRDPSPKNSAHLDRIRNRIEDIEKKLSLKKNYSNDKKETQSSNNCKQRDIDEILRENRELKKELEKKNIQIQSLIDLNLDLEDQLNEIKQQNEKEYSMVERASLNLKENLGKILGENDGYGC